MVVKKNLKDFSQYLSKNLEQLPRDKKTDKHKDRLKNEMFSCKLRLQLEDNPKKVKE